MDKKKFVIVGAGYSGLRTLNWLIEKGVTNLSLVESDDFAGGRANSGLHTVSTDFPDEIFQRDYPIQESLVRWNKTWTSFEDVDWKDKNWSQVLPQWNDFFVQKQRVVDELLIQPEIMDKVQMNTPIQDIFQNDEGCWELQTPSNTILAENVIWCAPMSSLQLCIGKINTQQFSCPNPKFQDGSQEFKGGLAFDWTFSKTPELNDIEFQKILLGIPVRHQTKLYLSLAVSVPEENQHALRTLTYLPEDILNSPKEVLSFQKSLRRTLRQHLKEDFKTPQGERWVVSPEIRGAVYAKPWVLKSQPRNNIFFCGEDTFSAANCQFTGIEATHHSLKNVFEELEYKIEEPDSAMETAPEAELSPV